MQLDLNQEEVVAHARRLIRLHNVESFFKLSTEDINALDGKLYKDVYSNLLKKSLPKSKVAMSQLITLTTRKVVNDYLKKTAITREVKASTRNFLNKCSNTYDLGLSKIQLRQMSEDFVQDAIIKLIRSSTQVPEQRKERIKLMKSIVRTLVIDYVRKNLRIVKSARIVDLPRERLEAIPDNSNCGWTVLEELDGLNELILQEKFLSEKELRLWHCLEQLMPYEQMVKELNSKKTIISTEAYRLRDKIRKRISKEDVYNYLATKSPVKAR